MKIPDKLPAQGEYIIVFLDIAGFHKNIVLKITSSELFLFMQEFYDCAEAIISHGNGKIIKFMGDAILVIFDPEELQNPVAFLDGMREALNEWIEKRCVGVRVHLKAHVGSVTIGRISSREFSHLDIFGPAVNETALLSNNDFVLSQDLSNRFKR